MNKTNIYLILKNGKKITKPSNDKYSIDEVKGVFVQFANGVERILSPVFLKEQRIFKGSDKKWPGKSECDEFDYTSTIVALNMFNGKKMSEDLYDYDSDAVREVRLKLGVNWYIPACGEMTNLLFNYKEINKFLDMVEGADKLSLKEYYWTSTRYNRTIAYNYDGGSGDIGYYNFYYPFTVSPITLPEDEDFLTNESSHEPGAPAAETIAKVNSEDNGAKKVVVTTGDVTTIEVNGVKIICRGNCEVVTSRMYDVVHRIRQMINL